jgi:hypothetical protein
MADRDLVMRLRACQRDSVQSLLGSDIFKQAADEVERLQELLNESCESDARCALKLNQIAVERDLARKERDSVSHRLGALKKSCLSGVKACDPDDLYDTGFRSALEGVLAVLGVSLNDDAVESLCPYCGAPNNGTCAYPSEGKPGCWQAGPPPVTTESLKALVDAMSEQEKARVRDGEWIRGYDDALGGEK